MTSDSSSWSYTINFLEIIVLKYSDPLFKTVQKGILRYSVAGNTTSLSAQNIRGFVVSNYKNSKITSLYLILVLDVASILVLIYKFLGPLVLYYILLVSHQLYLRSRILSYILARILNILYTPVLYRSY